MVGRNGEVRKHLAPLSYQMPLDADGKAITPGSLDAVARGCLCDPGRNNDGQGHDNDGGRVFILNYRCKCTAGRTQLARHGDCASRAGCVVAGRRAVARLLVRLSVGLAQLLECGFECSRCLGPVASTYLHTLRA